MASEQTTYAAIIGQILARHRKALNREQDAVAKRVGVSQSTWSRIERGSSALSVEQLLRAASILNTSPGALLNEAEQAKTALEAQNIEVKESEDEKASGGGGALIVGAVLGFLIARALAK